MEPKAAGRETKQRGEGVEKKKQNNKTKRNKSENATETVFLNVFCVASLNSKQKIKKKFWQIYSLNTEK